MLGNPHPEFQNWVPTEKEKTVLRIWTCCFSTLNENQKIFFEWMFIHIHLSNPWQHELSHKTRSTFDPDMVIMITMLHFDGSFRGEWRVMALACFPLNPVSPQVPFGAVSCRLQWERWHSSWLKRTNTAGQSSICLLCFCSRNKRWWDWREEEGRETARSLSEGGRWPVPEPRFNHIFCESSLSLFVLQSKCFFSRISQHSDISSSQKVQDWSLFGG